MFPLSVQVVLLEKETGLRTRMSVAVRKCFCLRLCLSVCSFLVISFPFCSQSNPSQRKLHFKMNRLCVSAQPTSPLDEVGAENRLQDCFLVFDITLFVLGWRFSLPHAALVWTILRMLNELLMESTHTKVVSRSVPCVQQTHSRRWINVKALTLSLISFNGNGAECLWICLMAQ